MLPTLQLVSLDRTEGPLGLRLLQLQVISKRQERKSYKRLLGSHEKGRRNGETQRLKCAVVGQRIARHRQV
jgi:hypothetical protein